MVKNRLNESIVIKIRSVVTLYFDKGQKKVY